MRNTDPSRPLRPLVIAGIVTAVAFAVGIPFAARALLHSFEQVESEMAEQRATQALRAFVTDLRQLAMSNRDYAEWDDAEEYAHSAAPDFIAGNFSSDSMEGMHVDLVWIVRNDGSTMYSGLLDRGLHELTTPAPAELLGELQDYARATPALEAMDPDDRIIPTAGGLMAISVVEIKRSDKSQPCGVHMLFGRFLRGAELERVRDTSQLPVEMTVLEKGMVPAAARLPPEIGRWASNPDFASHTGHAVLGDTEIGGYALLHDVHGKPAAVLSMVIPRDIFALGHRTTWTLLTGIAALVIAFGIMFSGLLWRLHRSLRERKSVDDRYRNIAAQLGEAILLVDSSSYQVIEANRTVLRALGYSRREVTTRSALDIYPDITPAILAGAADAADSRTVCQSRLRHRDGSQVSMEISITLLRDTGRRLLCLVGHDVSHRVAAEQQQRASQRKLIHMAQHDPLTGLPNRLYLRSKLPRALKHSAASGRNLALIYLDVDHFKSINDSRGHGFGDQLLQVVAKRLRTAVAAHDVVVRMGGDEFAIVAPLMTDPAVVESLAQRLQTAVSAPISIHGVPITVTASMGIAVHPQDGLEMEVLLKHADIALYQAKEAGRNTHRIFLANMDVRVSEDVALEQALRHAVDSKQIFVEYQPVIDIASNRIASFEALLRWRHPDLGIVPPGRFIPAAEKIGVIATLGQQALLEVVTQLQQWLAAGVPCVPIAVNVAPHQLLRTDFVALVSRLAAEAGVQPRWLRFEITESALLHGTEGITTALEQLRALGSQVLIDDFGTGYSALSYLSKLPIDTLKIDRSFVEQLGSRDSHSSIVSAIIDMARKLKLKTVAEGVETPEQLMLLKEHGCDFAQGYFFSKPVSARRCRLMLEQLQTTAANGASTIRRALHKANAADAA